MQDSEQDARRGTTQMASDTIAKPSPLLANFTPREWQVWTEEWTDYETLAELNKKPAKYCAATFRSCLGHEGRLIYNGLPFQRQEDRDDVKKALKLLQEYIIGKVNVTYERYVFFTRNQGEDELSKNYIAELRKLARTCDFENISPEQLIRDRVIYGLRNDRCRAVYCKSTTWTWHAVQNCAKPQSVLRRRLCRHRVD